MKEELLEFIKKNNLSSFNKTKTQLKQNQTTIFTADVGFDCKAGKKFQQVKNWIVNNLDF